VHMKVRFYGLRAVQSIDTLTTQHVLRHGAEASCGCSPKFAGEACVLARSTALE
jgi:hypothetical protein